MEGVRITIDDPVMHKKNANARRLSMVEQRHSRQVVDGRTLLYRMLIYSYLVQASRPIVTGLSGLNEPSASLSSDHATRYHDGDLPCQYGNLATWFSNSKGE